MLSVLVALKYMLLVYLNIGLFLTAQRKPWLANGSPTCELHSPHLRYGLEMILAVYREVHTHSFVLKHLLQWHVHVQRISTLEWYSIK